MMRSDSTLRDPLPGEVVRRLATCLEWAYVQRHRCAVAASR